MKRMGMINSRPRLGSKCAAFTSFLSNLIFLRFSCSQYFSKLLLTVAFLLAVSFYGNEKLLGQVIYSEDFNSMWVSQTGPRPPFASNKPNNEWYNFRYSNFGTYTWVREVDQSQENGFASGYNFISFIRGQIWMISPPIILSEVTSGYNLSWEQKNDLNNFVNTISTQQLRIGTSESLESFFTYDFVNNTTYTNNFENTWFPDIIYDAVKGIDDADEWTERTFPLSDYAGQTIYIAIRHAAPIGDVHRWDVDNLEIEEIPRFLNWIGSKSNDWNDPENWDLNIVPQAGSALYSKVVIPEVSVGNFDPVISDSNAATDDILIQSGGKLSFLNNFILDISGTMEVANGGEIDINDGELNVQGDLFLNGTLTCGEGTLNAIGNVFIEGTAEITTATTGELNIFKDVEVNGSPDMESITLSFMASGAQQLNGPVLIGGIYVDDTSELTIVNDITIRGDINVTSGTLNQNAGILIFSKTTEGEHNISGISPTVSFNNVRLDPKFSAVNLKMSPIDIHIAGNWDVSDGNYQFDNGTVVFNGSSPQTLTPGSNSYFNDVSLNTNLQVNDHNMVVKGALNIDEQVVSFASPNIFVQIDDGGSILHTDTGRIAGKVRHFMNAGTYTIPVGTESYTRRVQISYTNPPTAGYLDVAFESFINGTYGVFGSADYFYSEIADTLWDESTVINTISEEGVWLVSPAGLQPVNGGNYDISFDVVGMNELTIADYEKLRMVKTSDFNPADWHAPGTATVVSEIAQGYRLGRNNVTGYSRWALGSNFGDNPLPVELYSFTASAVDEEVVVEWVTAAEINNSHFVVERAFADGIFVPIARVPGAGNSNTMLSYSHTDYPQYTGMVYYRLTQHDFDGKNETFDPVAVRLDAPSLVKGRLQLYPNPASSHVNVVIQSPVDSRAVFGLYTATGRLVLQQRQELLHGNNQAIIRVGHLPAGVYILRIVSDDVVFEPQRLVVEN